MSLVLMHIVGAQPAQFKQLSKVYSAQTMTEGSYDPNSILVKFKPSYRTKLRDDDKNTGIASITSKLGRYKVTGFHRLAFQDKNSKTNSDLFGWYEISLDPNRPIDAKKENGKTVYPEIQNMESEFESDSSVESVSKNYLITTNAVPNDPYYSSSGSWGQTYDDLYGLKDINSAGAWDTTTGSSSTVIAVIDSGVDINQPDLAGNIWTNPSPGSDGYVNDTHGWNFCSNNNNVMDDNGHGTHVAGTIGAVGNNGLGVVGVNWNVKIMPVKFLCSNGSGTSAAAAQALEYAADNGAKISNNSWGEPTASDPVIDDAIAYEISKGVIPVVAAGNNTATALDNTPASADGVITVTAVDNTNTIASFANNGIRVDVSAPGVNILSLKSSEASSVCTGSEIVNTNYCVISGTSMATPHVAGTVGLMLSENPNLTLEQVRQILHTTATPLGTPGNYTYGYGLVNAQAAVTASASPTVLTPTITSPTSRVTVGGSLTFTGSADGATFASYKLEAGQGRTPSSWVTVATSSTPVANGTLATVDTSTLPDNSYTFRLTATDTNGQTYQYSIYDVLVHNADAIVSSPVYIMPKATNAPVIGEADFLNGLTFDHYTIDYGMGASPTTWSTTGVTLTNGGTQIESSTTDNLGTIDTSTLADGTQLTIRLTVYATNGSSKVVTQTLHIDQYLLSGWPKYMPGGNPGLPGETGGETLADLEGNSQQDVIIPSYGNTIYAYRKDGSQVPGWPVTVQSGDFFQNPPIIADLNGDLKPEIIIEASITGSYNKRLYIFESDGTPYPGWTPLVVHGNSWDDDPMPSVADLNDDGNKELVLDSYTSGSNSTLHAYNLDGTELSGWPKTIAYTPWVDMPPTISDINNDGYPEIVLARYNQVYVYDHTGNLLSGWPVTLPNYNSTLEAIQGLPAIGDLDGDGQKEVIVEGQPSNTYGNGITEVVYAYHANGTLLSGWPYVGSTGPANGFSDRNTPVTADINHDGKDEVYIGGADGGYVEDGVGRTANAGSPSKCIYSQTFSPSFGEFSNNGNVEIPMLTNGYAWLSNTDCSTYWGDFNMYTSTNEPNPDDAPIVTGDVDGSGQEALAAGITSNSVSLQANPYAFDGGINAYEHFVYLWQLPGSTSPVDSWPMIGHDPQHTNHYTVGQAAADTSPPQIAISEPSNNSAVTGTITVSATAIDNAGISKVDFYLDGTKFSSASTWPYSTTLDTSPLTLGSHTLTAEAYDTSNNETTSDPVTIVIPDLQPPTAPTGLQQTSVTDSSVSFSWDPSTDNVGVAGYDIYQNGVFLTATTSTNYTGSGLSPSTTYTYAVDAFDAAGNTSGQVSAPFTTTADTTPPSVPSNVSASNISDTSQQISWTPSTDNVGVAGYQLYRGTTLIATTTQTSFIDTNLTPLTTYSYTVKAYDAAGNYSTASSPLNSETVADTTLPSSPGTLQFNNVTLNSLSLSWSAGTDDIAVTGYDIYENGVYLGNTSSTSFPVNNLQAGTLYSFSVVTVDEAGNDSPSSSGQVTTLRKSGDVNNDGVVNIFDLSLLLSHFNQSYSPADFNNSGKVDIFDLSTLLSHYGK